MAEIPDRVPGGIILASYANEIRDRTLQRYASAVERDSLNALPAEGDLAYLADQDVVQVYAGGLWRDLTREDYVLGITDPLDDRLAAVEARLDAYRSEYTDGETSIGTSYGNISGQLSVPVDGNYVVTFGGVLALTTQRRTPDSLGSLLVRLLVDGVDEHTFDDIAIRYDPGTDRPIQVIWPSYFEWGMTLTAGQTVQWAAVRTSGLTEAASARDRRIALTRVS